MPIEKFALPTKSRDELPPILAGLQWIWMHPTLKAEIFALLEAKILAGKRATGRTGMDLWQILVLGVVRLGLDADWDRLEDLANHHTLIRQMLGVPALSWGTQTKVFARQTLRDNVALLDDELLQQINAQVAAAGREVFAKKGGAPAAALEIKVDSYVLEIDVHFPTDLNLRWDAGRNSGVTFGRPTPSGFKYPICAKFDGSTSQVRLENTSYRFGLARWTISCRFKKTGAGVAGRSNSLVRTGRPSRRGRPPTSPGSASTARTTASVPDDRLRMAFSLYADYHQRPRSASVLAQLTFHQALA